MDRTAYYTQINAGEAQQMRFELQQFHVTIRNQIEAADKQTLETKKLNTRIYWLTWATTILAAIQAYPIIKDFTQAMMK